MTRDSFAQLVLPSPIHVDRAADSFVGSGGGGILHDYKFFLLSKAPPNRAKVVSKCGHIPISRTKKKKKPLRLNDASRHVGR